MENEWYLIGRCDFRAVWKQKELDFFSLFWSLMVYVCRLFKSFKFGKFDHGTIFGGLSNLENMYAGILK